MTIEHNRRIVTDIKTVTAKGAWLGALTGGPRTSSLTLLPDLRHPSNDTVRINASYGSQKLKGEEINTNRTCQQNGVRWFNY